MDERIYRTKKRFYVSLIDSEYRVLEQCNPVVRFPPANAERILEDVSVPFSISTTDRSLRRQRC